jgi:hypothetical protein
VLAARTPAAAVEVIARCILKNLIIEKMTAMSPGGRRHSSSRAVNHAWTIRHEK